MASSVVFVNDVRVFEPGHRFGLSLEARREAGVGICQFRRENLTLSPAFP